VKNKDNPYLNHMEIAKKMYQIFRTYIVQLTWLLIKKEH
jgi:hypothetical protein